MNKKLATLILVVLCMYGLYVYFDLGTVLSFEMLQTKRDVFKAYVESAPLLSGITFGLLYFLVVVVSLPVATVLTLLAGFLFGTLWGTLLVIISATVGSVVIFSLARWLLKDWFVKYFGARIETLVNGFSEDAFAHMLVLRLIPVFPFFLVNIAPAFTRITTREYALATLIGMIPGTFVYVHAGKELGSINSISEIASPGVIGAFVLLGLLALVPALYKRMRSR